MVSYNNQCLMLDVLQICIGNTLIVIELTGSKYTIQIDACAQPQTPETPPHPPPPHTHTHTPTQPFPSSLPKTNFNFSFTFILSSANTFNLDQPKIYHLVKS